LKGIEFCQVAKRFKNGHEALRDVSVYFEPATMSFLTGRSGAGKTTFLRLILLLSSPTRGEILVNGINISKLPRSRLASYRRHIGVVFQDHNLLGYRNVFENVAIPLWVAGIRDREIRSRVRAALSAVDMLDKALALPTALSTGERQRVGIARAVVNRPKILLADEPTGNLDPVLSRTVMELLQRFQAYGTTVIVASHDLDLINEMRLPIVELSKGMIVKEDSSDLPHEQ
jgi:cell division transport system ATP-binding protein